MVTRKTKVRRRFGALGVAMIFAATSLVVGAVPASASGFTHYENVGNPGWCLDGNLDGKAYLHRCGFGGIDYQKWYYTHGSDNLQLKHEVSGDCLAVLPHTVSVGLLPCSGTDKLTFWDARGTNGWVKLINKSVPVCVAPVGTGEAGKTRYELEVMACNPANPNADPYDITNVPNIVAWRYFL